MCSGRQHRFLPLASEFSFSFEFYSVFFFFFFLVLPSVLLLRALPVVGEEGSVYRRLPSPSSPRRSVDGVAHRPVELGPDPNLFKLLDRDLVNSPNHGGNITACSLQLLAGESKASLSHDTRL